MKLIIREVISNNNKRILKRKRIQKQGINFDLEFAFFLFYYFPTEFS